MQAGRISSVKEVMPLFYTWKTRSLQKLTSGKERSQKVVMGQDLFRGKTGTDVKVPELTKLLDMQLLCLQLLFAMQTAILCAAGHPRSASSCPGGDWNLCPCSEHVLGLLPIAIYDKIITDLQESRDP